ncbi:hypothetical protein BDN70DRAFT_958075 [Pholiota conissans]|uniref:Uncharacterized protein n=1 Tax=Pholiota conissans TaxID=109636 RepID=A0A9P5YTC3_9AGAR|nr:hypothetical protein BDN70DRAFT_958075 [Pholiota conissans]
MWDILWGCLATIFACSWVSVHPNIPPASAKWWKVGLIRLELMIWTIIAPELIMFWAARQWMGARQVAKRYKERGWTKTHGYFIQMGGFILVDGNVKKEVLSIEYFNDLCDRRRYSRPQQGDALSKGLVIIQTTWFITQFVGRILQGLSGTQLELMTLGFAALNGFMYFFWWNKPLDVRLPVMIHLVNPTASSVRVATCDTIGSAIKSISTVAASEKPNTRPSWLASLSAKLSKTAWQRIQIFYLKQHQILRGRLSVPIWYASGITAVNIRLVSVCVAAIGVIFGAIHCIGWNLIFPSTLERQLWRMSSLVISIYPALTVLAIVPTSIFRDVFQIEQHKFGIYDAERYSVATFVNMDLNLYLLFAGTCISSRCPNGASRGRCDYRNLPIKTVIAETATRHSSNTMEIVQQEIHTFSSSRLGSFEPLSCTFHRRETALPLPHLKHGVALMARATNGPESRKAARIAEAKAGREVEDTMEGEESE